MQSCQALDLQGAGQSWSKLMTQQARLLQLSPHVLTVLMSERPLENAVGEELQSMEGIGAVKPR